MQKHKTYKPSVDKENAVPAEIEGAGTSDELPRPLGQKSAKRVAKEIFNLAALTKSTTVMAKAILDAALHVNPR
uniref:Uncharacterized protein n=1 Tax=Hyaloperonospora arabidopsidis (strain Emoy2) TaxID=559515 RepID=M4B6C0_HYAAE